jgi:hypothetical protein
VHELRPSPLVIVPFEHDLDSRSTCSDGALTVVFEVHAVMSFEWEEYMSQTWMNCINMLSLYMSGIKRGYWEGFG